jgi:serine/threonine protein kinase
MLTGSPPFPHENACVAMHARLTADPAAPRKINRELSPQAEEIVLRALQREPDQRYPTAASMKAELDRPEHVRVTGLGERLQEPAPRNWRQVWTLVAATAGTIVTGFLVLAFLSVRHHAGLW